MTHKYTSFNCPFCSIILVGSNAGISHVHLQTGEGAKNFIIDTLWQKDDNFFYHEKKQFDNYFEGSSARLDIKLNIAATPFQKKVWSTLQTIPYGQVYTYGDIARKIGNSKAARAVGMANNKNPVPIIIPCHRVIGTNGKLTGFSSGVTIKKKLLELEAANRYK